MGNIPEDATHWDSGDWIDWHRSPTGIDVNIRAAATHDPMARQTALHVSLLRAARGFFELTGDHLPVYQQIANVHAAIYCDLPLEGNNRTCTETGIEVLHLPPSSLDDVVEIDLTRKFATLIVVRINENFTCEARMIQRSALPYDADGPFSMHWEALPFVL